MGWTKIEALGWAVQVKEGIDAESLRAVALEAIGSVIELLDEQEAVRAALWRGGLREVDFAEDGAPEPAADSVPEGYRVDEATPTVTEPAVAPAQEA